MESSLSCVSSLRDEAEPVFIQPHYKESYRLAIYALTSGGRQAYEDFIQAEQISSFLSSEEIHFILENAELPVPEEEASEAKHDITAAVAAAHHQERSPPTYFPSESDEEIPELDLGWPEVGLDDTDTSISLLFHPPRQHTPTVKDVIRRQIQDAKQVIAVAMDVFTDVDILRALVGAALRGVVVYILLDHFHFRSFLNMSERYGVKIHHLKNIRVRTIKGPQYQCQSGAKFHGALEQRFLLVDCRTVIYGTYSYTWSFEKINVSMVLVITGQLVASYDEEFRRLYARSVVPATVSEDRPSLRHLVSVLSPASSQLFLSPASSQLPVLSPASSQLFFSPTSSQLPVLSPASSQLFFSPTSSQLPVLSPASSQLFLSPASSQLFLSPTSSQLPVLSPASSQLFLSPASSQLPVLSPASSQRPVLSPASSQLSLNLGHLKSRATQGLRSPNDDRYHAGGPALSRGLSMQERLHQSHHYPDMGCLVRGNSYGGELHRANSTSRLRGAGAPEKTTAPPPLMGGGEDPPPGAASSRMHRFYHQQRSRFPPDQYPLPYNSETSLHRWKMDSYFGNGDAGTPADAAPYDVVSPQSSQTALNENHRPGSAFQGRAWEIRSRLEEIRMKRLSLQEYNGAVTSPRQSQESLASAYSTLDKWRSSLKAVDNGYNTAELEQNAQRRGFGLDPAYKGDGLKPRDEGGAEREPPFTPTALTDGHRSTSQCDIKKVSAEIYDWYEPLSRAASAANLDVKLTEPSLKPHHNVVRPSGLNAPHSRVMQSLHEIPEEKEGPGARESSGSVNREDEKKTTSKDEGKVRAMNSTASNVSVPGPQRQDLTRESHDSMKSSGSAALGKATSSKETTAPKGDSVSGVSAGGQLVVKAKGSVHKVQTRRDEPAPQTKSSTQSKETPALQRKDSIRSKETPTLQRNDSIRSKETPTLQRKDSIRSKETPTLQRNDSIRSKETPTLQRKNSLRLKVLNIFTSDERKTSQRKSLTQSSKTPPGSVPPDPTGAPPPGAPYPVAKPSASEQKPSKGQAAAGLSRSHSAVGRALESERPHQRRPSMRRPPPAAIAAASDQDRGSRITLEGEGSSVPQARRAQAYSRFEHFLTAERSPPDRAVRTAERSPPDGAVRTSALYSSDRERCSFVSGGGDAARGYSRYQTPTAADNKLGRFMQRVGSLMGKNK